MESPPPPLSPTYILQPSQRPRGHYSGAVLHTPGWEGWLDTQVRAPWPFQPPLFNKDHQQSPTSAVMLPGKQAQPNSWRCLAGKTVLYHVNNHELGMVAVRRQRLEGQKFRVNLGYMVSSTPALATWDPVIPHPWRRDSFLFSAFTCWE